MQVSVRSELYASDKYSNKDTYICVFVIPDIGCNLCEGFKPTIKSTETLSSASF